MKIFSLENAEERYVALRQAIVDEWAEIHSAENYLRNGGGQNPRTGAESNRAAKSMEDAWKALHRRRRRVDQAIYLKTALALATGRLAGASGPRGFDRIYRRAMSSIPPSGLRR